MMPATRRLTISLGEKSAAWNTFEALSRSSGLLSQVAVTEGSTEDSASRVWWRWHNSCLRLRMSQIRVQGFERKARVSTTRQGQWSRVQRAAKCVVSIVHSIPRLGLQSFVKSSAAALHTATTYADPMFADQWTAKVASQLMGLWEDHYAIKDSHTPADASHLAGIRTPECCVVAQSGATFTSTVRHMSLAANEERCRYQQRFAHTDRLQGVPDLNVLRKRQRQENRHVIAQSLTSQLLSVSTVVHLLSSATELLLAIKGCTALLPLIGFNVNCMVRVFHMTLHNKHFYLHRGIQKSGSHSCPTCCDIVSGTQRHCSASTRLTHTGASIHCCWTLRNSRLDWLAWLWVAVR